MKIPTNSSLASHPSRFSKPNLKYSTKTVNIPLSLVNTLIPSEPIVDNNLATDPNDPIALALAAKRQKKAARKRRRKLALANGRLNNEGEAEAEEESEEDIELSMEPRRDSTASENVPTDAMASLASSTISIVPAPLTPAVSLTASSDKASDISTPASSHHEPSRLDWADEVEENGIPISNFKDFVRDTESIKKYNEGTRVNKFWSSSAPGLAESNIRQLGGFWKGRHNGRSLIDTNRRGSLEHVVSPSSESGSSRRADSPANGSEGGAWQQVTNSKPKKVKVEESRWKHDRYDGGHPRGLFNKSFKGRGQVTAPNTSALRGWADEDKVVDPPVAPAPVTSAEKIMPKRERFAQENSWTRSAITFLFNDDTLGSRAYYENGQRNLQLRISLNPGKPTEGEPPKVTVTLLLKPEPKTNLHWLGENVVVIKLNRSHAPVPVITPAAQARLERERSVQESVTTNGSLTTDTPPAPSFPFAGGIEAFALAHINAAAAAAPTTDEISNEAIPRENTSPQVYSPSPFFYGPPPMFFQPFLGADGIPYIFDPMTGQNVVYQGPPEMSPELHAGQPFFAPPFYPQPDGMPQTPPPSGVSSGPPAFFSPARSTRIEIKAPAPGYTPPRRSRKSTESQSARHSPMNSLMGTRVDTPVSESGEQTENIPENGYENQMVDQSMMSYHIPGAFAAGGMVYYNQAPPPVMYAPPPPEFIDPAIVSVGGRQPVDSEDSVAYSSANSYPPLPSDWTFPAFHAASPPASLEQNNATA